MELLANKSATIAYGFGVSRVAGLASLNCVCFWVLRCVADCRFGHFLCSGFRYLIQSFYFVELSQSYSLRS